MTTFDPKEKKGRSDSASRTDKSARRDFPSRDDSRSSDYHDNSSSAFLKDQRKEKRPRLDNRPSDPAREEGNAPRRSYNPNFTKDNRKREDGSSFKKPYQREDRENNRSDREGSRPYRSDDRSRDNYGDRKEGFRASGDRPFQKDNRSSDRPYGDRPRRDGERSFHKEERANRSDRPYDDRRQDKPFHKSDKPYRSDDRPFQKEGRSGERPFSKDTRGGDRPYGDRPHHDGERSFRKDDRAGRGDRPYGDRPRQDKSFHKSDKPYRSDDRPRGNYGDRKEGFRPNSGPRKPAFKQYDAENYPRFEAPKQIGAIRLNRFIANSGVCSRREADDLIAAGVVSVNGTVVSELGTKVYPNDEIRFNGEVIHGEKKVYILMNKPKGFVTSLDDPHADKTVMELIKNACTERVYPVGRLDKNSVGVLLFTNDGELTRQLTHPSYKKNKIYQVSIDKSLTEADMERIANGIELEDGLIFADEISYVGDSRKEIGIEIHSGRNRIVRRIFESLGYSVQKLDRVYFAGLTKKGLKRGAWRFLTPKEVSMLKSGEYQ